VIGRRGQAREPERPDTNDLGAMFRWCLARGLDARPHYVWGSLLAAHTAAALGQGAFSAIEFGVAGGNGLLALETAAGTAAELLGVDAEVYGFDTGTGMPPPVDHRDVPWVISPGLFELDEPRLRARLISAELVLGPVAETVPRWLSEAHAPIAFAAFDLDYYSATIDAFAVFDAPDGRLLPRVVCYFDDVFGLGWSDFVGERAAITDFNASHERRKIGKIHGLRYDLPDGQQRLPWHEQMYLAHLFDHPDYATRVAEIPEAWLDAHRLPPDG
jgi:hypothetical protein